MNISRHFQRLSTRQWPRIGTAICGLAAFMFASPVGAVSVTDVFVNNTSDANQNIYGAVSGRTIEFQTAVSGISPVSTTGLTSQFTTHVSWFLGHEVDPGSFPFANIAQKHVSYEVAFTVQDPLNIGYHLAVDTDLFGYLTSVYDSGAQTLNGTQASGTALYGKIDTGSGFGSLINNLTVTPDGAEVAKANYLDPSDNVLVQDESNYNGGDFVGTRNFRLQFSSRPSPNVSSILQNNIWGRNGVRFGLNPTDSDLSELLTPGADGELASDLGHFVNVLVTAKGTVPAPETGSTFALLAASFGAVVFASRRPMK